MLSSDIVPKTLHNTVIRTFLKKQTNKPKRQKSHNQKLENSAKPLNLLGREKDLKTGKLRNYVASPEGLLGFSSTKVQRS